MSADLAPMKILLVHDYGALVGGAEIGIFALRDGLRERGHDARLFASSAFPWEEGEGPDYSCFGSLANSHSIVRTYNPSAAAALRRVVREFRPDVVHVAMFLTQLSPSILPVLRDVPCLYFVQWYEPICPTGNKMLPDGTSCCVRAGTVCYRGGCVGLRAWAPAMVQLALTRMWKRSFEMIVANSETVRRRLEADGFGPARVAWLGVPAVEPSARRASAPTIAFAGRLAREKGVDVLVRAMDLVVKKVPNARLLIAGNGPQRTAIADRVAELNLADNVDLLGHLARADVEAALGGAWVQAVPSQWEEPFGLVTAEAMMRGTPVVASALGGALDLLRDGETGLLVPPGDATLLADALVRVLTDRELADRLSRSARAFALDQLTEDAYVNRFVGLYESLLGRADAESAGAPGGPREAACVGEG